MNNLRMTPYEAIKVRHSVRIYRDEPLREETVRLLNDKIEEINTEGNLHIQLITNEPRAFTGLFAYGKFRGVSNYFVMAGRRDKNLDERIGYYGEQLVVYSQMLGLNTCWAGLSYRKIKDTFRLNADEKVACYIALGYGKTQGGAHKSKTIEQVSNASQDSPSWFVEGVKVALLAPTAINQQKFYFEYVGMNEGNHYVKAKKMFSAVGYTNMDLGIAKYHFEIGAGKENFEWIE